MEIKGIAHCFFEQSGTFKNEFIKLGIPAKDYDIQDKFGQTDHVIDLFREIEKAYENKESIFDSITKDDLVLAFYPCTYFETVQQLTFALSLRQDLGKPMAERIDKAINRLEKRTYYHCLLYKFYAVCFVRGLRLIIENPATAPNYLITGQNFPPPTFIDNNRRIRGDYFKKPTAYWFVNCEPGKLLTAQMDKELKKIESINKDKPIMRSIISGDYARNFICDFILGRSQEGTQMLLFNG